MITLYQRTDCPFCWKVRLALAELGLSYESVDISLGEKHPDVQALSPTGTVPVLVDDGVAIWESSVILDFLDRRYGERRLVPSEAEEEARVRLLTVYSDKIVGGCLKDVVFEKRSKPEREWNAELLREAAERGCTTLDGLGMLVNQGVIGFKIWTGIDPEASVMREALEEYLEI